MIGESFAHYRITGKLGAGGMGEVYRARDTKLKREVAIKVLPEAFARDAERMKRLEREAQVLASLNHPNIAAIYGLEDVDGIRALVLELVEGPTLAERIASGPMPLDEILKCARQMAVGLEAAHEKSVIHRDLKPANVKLTKEGDIKILDFGLAKALEGEMPDVEDSNSPTLTRAGTQAGVLLGTAAYMSPEQAKGKPVDRRADVWAFGVVLFEMLTGTKLFSGETVSETLASVIKDEPELDRLPPETPKHIRRLLYRCLTKDPAERLQAIGEARIAIDRPETELETSVAPSDRVRSQVALAAFAVLVASVITGVTVRQFESETPRPVVRVMARPPSSETLDTAQGDVDVAITPGGTHIIYLVTVGGARQLAVRALDRLETLLLPGLGDPRGPFLSPDGNWVGYFDGIVALKKVSILGGAPLTVHTLTEAGSASRGASWGDDNTIVFATAAVSELWRVAASGGEAEELTKPESATEDHVFPEVLPGSKAVLFTILRRPVEGSAIAVLSLPTGESKVLIPGGSHPRYAPTGHIVYGIDGRLRAVAFDLQTLEVTSDPVPILEGLVTKDTGAANFDVARDGSLVYITGSPGRRHRTLAWVDRQGRESALAAPPRNYSRPQISPDGSRLAVEARDRDADIWIWDFGRETLTRFTFDPGPDRTPVWSPDGLRVAFSSGIPPNLFWKAADGTGGVERLTESSNAQWVEAIALDGKHLVFRELEPETRYDLHVLSLLDRRSSAPLIATEFNERGAEISPDGRYVAYQSDESGQYEIYVRPFPNVEDGRWPVSRNGGVYPVWARNGRELFFITPEGQIKAVPFQIGPGVGLGSVETVVENALYQTGARSYDVSPDGEHFLLVREDGAERELILVLNWGEELKRLIPPGELR